MRKCTVQSGRTGSCTVGVGEYYRLSDHRLLTAQSPPPSWSVSSLAFHSDPLVHFDSGSGHYADHRSHGSNSDSSSHCHRTIDFGCCSHLYMLDLSPVFVHWLDQSPADTANGIHRRCCSFDLDLDSFWPSGMAIRSRSTSFCLRRTNCTDRFDHLSRFSDYRSNGSSSVCCAHSVCAPPDHLMRSGMPAVFAHTAHAIRLASDHPAGSPPAMPAESNSCSSVSP